MIGTENMKSSKRQITLLIKKKKRRKITLTHDFPLRSASRHQKDIAHLLYHL